MAVVVVVESAVVTDVDAFVVVIVRLTPRKGSDAMMADVRVVSQQTTTDYEEEEGRMMLMGVGGLQISVCS